MFSATSYPDETVVLTVEATDSALPPPLLMIQQTQDVRA